MLKDFKNAIKAIDKSFTVRKDTYQFGLNEGEVQYKLKYEKMLLCMCSVSEEINELVKNSGYRVKYDGVITGAVRKNKKLNYEVCFIVPKED